MGDQPAWVDLSRNLPGELVGAEASRQWRSGGDAAARSWELGADGEWAAAERVRSLTTVSRWDRWRGRRPRWWVLHSVLVGVGSSDIDHVLGGPAGVFTVNTKHHQIGKVRIDGDELTLNRRRVDYAAKALFEAERAQRLLSEAVAGAGRVELAALGAGAPGVGDRGGPDYRG